MANGKNTLHIIIDSVAHVHVWVFCFWFRFHISLACCSFSTVFKREMIIVVYNFDNDQYTYFNLIMPRHAIEYYGFLIYKKIQTFSDQYNYIFLGEENEKKNTFFRLQFPIKINGKNWFQTERIWFLIHGIAKQSIINWISINFSLSFYLSLTRSLT